MANLAIIAVAGGRKTQALVDRALAADGRVLVTTYTNQNAGQLRRRIAEQAGGVVPANVRILSWVRFLLAEGVRPYQSFVFGEPSTVTGVNVETSPPEKASAARPTYRYLDGGRRVYCDRLAELATRVNEASGGRLVRRLERVFDTILIDEMQDLVGWDLELLDALFRSASDIILAGDPRQFMLQTGLTTKNRQHRGVAFAAWLAAPGRACECDTRCVSHRCNQQICDFASRVFPDLPPLASAGVEPTGHDGVFEVAQRDVSRYVEKYRPQVLRHKRTIDTLGLPAMNIGVAKGSTFPRVLVFPTESMRTFFRTQELAAGSRARLYVAVTRAVHSVAFVGNYSRPLDLGPRPEQLSLLD